MYVCMESLVCSCISQRHQCVYSQTCIQFTFKYTTLSLDGATVQYHYAFLTRGRFHHSHESNSAKRSSLLLVLLVFPPLTGVFGFVLFPLLLLLLPWGLLVLTVVVVVVVVWLALDDDVVSGGPR